MQTGTSCAKERPNIYPQVLTENSFKYSAHCQHLVLKINTVAIRLLHLVSIKAGCQVVPSPPFTPVEMRIGGRPSSGIRFIALPTGLPTWVIFPENTEALSVYKKQTTRKDNIKTVIMIKNVIAGWLNYCSCRWMTVSAGEAEAPSNLAL